MIATTESFAETAASDIPLPAHHDWAGHTERSETKDGSVLNEYIAQTISPNMVGAVLSVSMIPRFSCTPVTTISVNDTTITSTAAYVKFTVLVDDQLVDYPTILDRVGPRALFSLSSVKNDQQKLRSLLDPASWVTYKWSLEPDAPQLSTDATNGSSAQEGGNVDFSLLGSRRTIDEMEEMCRSHIPLPFND